MTPQQFLTEFAPIASAPNGVQKLREMVLQLAVQGRLTEHHPQDGDVDREIVAAQAERQAYWADVGGGASKGDGVIPLTELPNAIPSHWRWSALGNLARYVQRGKGPKYAEQGRVRVISQKCIQWRGFDLSPARWIEDQTIGTYGPERTLLKDDLLWNSTGTGTAGRIAIFPEIPGTEAVADSHVTVIRPTAAIISRYLWCLVASPGVQTRIEPTHPRSIVSGTTNQVELSTSTVRTLPVPLPPLAEQKRIVAKVDELMGLCDRLEALRNQRKSQRAVLTKELLVRLAQGDANDVQKCLQNLSHLVTDADQVPEIRKGILSLAVQGKLVPQDTGDEPVSQFLGAVAEARKQVGAMDFAQVTVSDAPYKLPNTWEWICLGNLALRSDAGWSPQCLGEPRAGDRWGVLKVSAVSWGKFEPEQNKALPMGLEGRLELEVKAGDFLLSRANTEDLVARSVIVESTPPRLMMSDKIVRFIFPDVVEKAFVNIVNSSSFARQYYAKRASGTSSSMKNVGRDVMGRLPVPTPPLAEQKRIVAKVEQLMALCDTLETRLRQASEVQALLATSAVAVLTGIQTQEKEAMKPPKTELVARLKLGKKPSTKDHSPLASFLARNDNELSPNALFQRSGMSIDEFYRQLKVEMNQGWIVQPEVPSMKVEERR